MRFDPPSWCIVVLAAAPLPAAAGELGYSYLDAAYVTSDVGGEGSSADGFGLRGSVGFAQDAFAFGEYLQQRVEGSDIPSFSVGVGGRCGLADRLDLVGRLGWTVVELAAGPFNISADGYFADLGLRGRLGKAFELEAGLHYADYGAGGEAGLRVGGRIHLNARWALGAELRSGDGSSSALAYVRAGF